MERLSYSQLNGFTGCGERYRLERILHVPQRPAWALIGGSAFHETTENHDLREHGVDVPDANFAAIFDRKIAEAEEESGLDRSQFRASGRASKQWPDKENEAWWRAEGPTMLLRWINFRRNAPWDIWITPDGMPAVEIEFDLILGDDEIDIKGYIDRVMVDRDGSLIVLDIKGLAVDTPIATPSGWSTMGELSVGDEVFGSDGKPTTVTAKSSVKRIGCYRVTFDDATSIVCDEEHLWQTHAGVRALDVDVRSIDEIVNTLRIYGQSHHRIPVTEPLVLPRNDDLLIDPYVLGVWLGDGKHTSGEFTTAREDTFIPEELERIHYAVSEHKPRKSTVRNWNILGLPLRAAGLYRNKHVPEGYLRASIGQRLALLRGLMDTDGTINRARGNRAVFAVTNPALADAVHELVTSLGERAHRTAHNGHGFGKDVKVHTVEWKPARFNPFLMPRKADLVDLSRATAQSRRRVIVGVEQIPSVETVCIAVDNDSHLYLAGREMIATHNTGSRKVTIPRQLGTYKQGILSKWPAVEHVRYGVYWDARTGTTGDMYPLNAYDMGRLEYQYRALSEARRTGLYLPNPGMLCSSCSVSDRCYEFSPEALGSTRPPWVSVDEWESGDVT